MNREEDIISFDFQGWPNYKKNLREVLQSLGAVEENGMIGFKLDDKVLDIYPVTMEDDGMAYGVNEKFITESEANREEGYINIFIEPQSDISKVDF
jgi:hypothetical protein